jgi:hypothetical protein
VARTFRRSLAAAVAFALLAGATFAFGFEPITALWLRRPINVAPLLVAGMATWCVIEAAGTAVATLLNAANVLRYQLLTALAFSAICLPGKAWVLIHYGIAGIPWVTIVTYLLAAVLPFVLLGRRVLADALARNTRLPPPAAPPQP